MLGSRRGRPSLIGSAARTAARTAVVVKTAEAVSRPRGTAPQPATAAPAAPSAPAASGGLDADAIARLKELADLRTAGILTDAEFEEQKARILQA
jgi:hypothetical protein